jgi:hypothetical protein
MNKEIYTESKKWGMGQTSRTDFIETWLFEMPAGTGNFATFEGLVFIIRDLIGSGVEPVTISENLKKIEGINRVLYWREDNENILIGVELEKRPEGLVVRLTGKNPALKGKPPYASNLYMDAMNDQQKSIRFLSDIKLSDEGYGIWKKLFNLGNKISVYDIENPGKTFKTFDSSEELDEFFRHGDSSFQRYQYILSPKVGTVIAEMRSNFHIRRIRETTPLGVED